MENFLFKKSYQLNTFLSLPYKSLWGANGIFTTIRLYGDSPELILLDEHLKKFNSSVKKFNIHFKRYMKVKFILNYLFILNFPILLFLKIFIIEIFIYLLPNLINYIQNLRLENS